MIRREIEIEQAGVRRFIVYSFGSSSEILVCRSCHRERERQATKKSQLIFQGVWGQAVSRSLPLELVLLAVKLICGIHLITLTQIVHGSARRSWTIAAFTFGNRGNTNRETHTLALAQGVMLRREFSNPIRNI